MQKSPIKVLVVDDSAFMRQLITGILSSDPEIEVVGTAPDPLVAREKIKQLNPDVVTLDIEMPHMDGIEFLRRLMTLRPTRVLMISTLTSKNADSTLRALALGAIDCLEKPLDRQDGTLSAFRMELLAKIHVVASAQLGAFTAPAPRSQACKPFRSVSQDCGIIAIGASTGGVEALHYVLQDLPAGLPPIVIVQHMPPRFTAGFANRLNSASDVEVFEAAEGQEIRAGQAALACGGHQFEIRRKGERLFCHVFEGEAVSGHAPSADVLFSSVAASMGPAAIGVILTGMGHDGAQGLLAMRQAGAHTIGQNKQTSLVYGMPRVAAEIGAVEQQAPLDHIPGLIMQWVENAGAPESKRRA